MEAQLLRRVGRGCGTQSDWPSFAMSKVRLRVHALFCSTANCQNEFEPSRLKLVRVGGVSALRNPSCHSRIPKFSIYYAMRNQFSAV
eukprot:6213955-Pleurochrysis_carterae.AAC.2